jgi:CRISPR-associated protein Cmx8
VENIFLLHFWILVSLIYIPRRIKKDSKSNSFILEEIGYVLTVPEPVNLEYFVEDARRLLGTLETDKSGFRPRSALISLPEESGLEYYFGLAMSKIETREISYSLASVEIYHLEKQGNNIKILAANHLSPDLKILTGYNSIREQCRNLLWRSIRITNLLTGKLWFANIDTLFNRYPYEFFIYKRDKTPSRFPFFGHDVGKKFNAIMDNLKGGDLMSEVTPDDRLALCIYRLIREYANRKTEEKSGIKYDGFKNNKDKDGHTIYPPKYLETKEDICSGAFLAMRSRNGQDFIEFFISTMGSVPQFLPEKDYLLVSQMLISQPEIVKNLSMLALSAHSR